MYPVKELREAAQLLVTRSPEARIALYTRLVKARVEEIQTLAETRRSGSKGMSAALRRLDDHLAALNEQVEETVERRATEPGGVNSNFLKTLDEAAKEQASSKDALEAASKEAPNDARAALQRSIEVLQRARGRVAAALEAVRPRDDK